MEMGQPAGLKPVGWWGWEELGGPRAACLSEFICWDVLPPAGDTQDGGWAAQQEVGAVGEAVRPSLP